MPLMYAYTRGPFGNKPGSPVSNEQEIKMNNPTNKNSFMVVMGGGDFYVAPITDTKWRETNASKNERAKLVRSLGLHADGSLPGLLEENARRMARQMGNARRRKARQRRRA
jgi:hypothetical protein